MMRDGAAGDHKRLRARLDSELARLGLKWHEVPSLPGGFYPSVEELLSRLTRLKVGSSWYDALPALPQGWIPGRPETWPEEAYRPFGPYDYQERPESFVAHVVWNPPDGVERLDSLVVAARDAGWPVFGAGMIRMNPNVKECHALIVLERGVTSEKKGAFRDWLERQRNLEFTGSPRWGDEED